VCVWGGGGCHNVPAFLFIIVHNVNTLCDVQTAVASHGGNGDVAV
jgi:hypothetical protein